MRSVIETIKNNSDYESYLIANSPDGFEALRRTRPVSWVPKIDGICPGGNCATGLQHNSATFSAVPNSVCQFCRFKVTGPIFLVGQTIEFNALSVRLHSAARRIRNLRQQKDAAEDAGDIKELRRIEAELEMADRESDQMVAEWAMRLSDIRASNELLERQVADSSKYPLITGASEGELRAKLDEAHHFDLLDRFTQCAEFFPSNRSTTIIEAIRHKHEIINRLLYRNGSQPILLSLPDDVALQTGNLFSDMLIRLLPQHDSVNGQSTLDRVLEGLVPLQELPLVEQHVNRLVNQAEGWMLRSRCEQSTN